VAFVKAFVIAESYPWAEYTTSGTGAAVAPAPVVAAPDPRVRTPDTVTHPNRSVATLPDRRRRTIGREKSDTKDPLDWVLSRRNEQPSHKI
jgi:hypothetical protein